MRIVSKCPVCSRKMRFPINKGKLLIRCPHCGNQFVFDPDIRRMWKQLMYRLKNSFGLIRKRLFNK
jgi:DNA-directed RNA polymerase subunit RPC12/RpoP